MRTGIVSCVLAAVCLVATGAAAQDDRAFVQGVGGIRLTSATSFAPSFGAMVGGPLTPNLQAVGEFGRMSDVLPPLVDAALAFTPADFRLSAWYGIGGVRLMTAPGHVRAYAETLAGVARLSSTIHGIASPTTDAIVNTALQFVDTTDPLAAAGVGVVVQSGAFVANVGYRFTRIFDSAEAGLLTGGNLDINELRFGVGFRF